MSPDMHTDCVCKLVFYSLVTLCTAIKAKLQPAILMMISYHYVQAFIFGKQNNQAARKHNQLTCTHFSQDYCAAKNNETALEAPEIQRLLLSILASTSRHKRSDTSSSLITGCILAALPLHHTQRVCTSIQGTAVLRPSGSGAFPAWIKHLNAWPTEPISCKAGFVDIQV